jgi:hypothetical protein
MKKMMFTWKYSVSEWIYFEGKCFNLLYFDNKSNHVKSFFGGVISTRHMCFSHIFSSRRLSIKSQQRKMCGHTKTCVRLCGHTFFYGVYMSSNIFIPNSFMFAERVKCDTCSKLKWCFEKPSESDAEFLIKCSTVALFPCFGKEVFAHPLCLPVNLSVCQVRCK